MRWLFITVVTTLFSVAMAPVVASIYRKAKKYLKESMQENNDER